jgi:hypothetical protein
MAPDRQAAAGCRRRASAAAAALLLALLPLAAGAQLFVCKTPSGRTLTDDKPPPECAKTIIRELNRDGSLKRLIEPPLTPEQRQERDAEDKRRREREMEAQAQLRRDRALLETYASEDEIESVRDRTLAQRKTLIDHAKQTLNEYKADRKHLDDESEFYLHRPMPDKLKRAIDDNVAQQAQVQHTIDDLRGEMQHINEHYDAELHRFRELIMRGSTPAPR